MKNKGKGGALPRKRQKNMKKRTSKAFSCFLSVAVLCISTGSIALACWYTVGDTDNILTMVSYQNRIVEEYQIPDHVDPGAEIDKIVNVKNTGTVDTLIRVSVEKAFGTRKSDGSFEKEGELNPDMIQIVYHTDYWSAREDGYFYYKDVLEAGKTTKEPLFTSFTLSPKIGDAYEGKDAQIIVRMESIQAEGNAVSLWGLTYKELGIDAPESAKAIPTQVNYRGRMDGFDITSKHTDLFASFKNLLPGCSRAQEIFLENDSDETVELFLRADTAEQEQMSRTELRLVEQLLKEYATVEITHDGTLIYEGPVNGNLDKLDHTMKNDISLGSILPHKKEELKVKLSLDPSMDNKFLKLTGKVKWIFTAKGNDEEAISTVYPDKTGLSDLSVWHAAAFFTSLLLGAAILSWPRRKKKERL